MREHRLAVLHTLAALAERFKGMLAQRYPALDTFHMVDESLLQDLIRHGPSPALEARIVNFARLAEDDGATAILFTCSSTSPAVDVARTRVAVPIVKIDDAMAEIAAGSGERIGIVCTTPSTKGPSADLVRSYAERDGRTVTIDVALREEAYRALIAGDRACHDAIVTEAALSLAQDHDVVVLAQASLAHLQPAIAAAVDVPVLASPETCLAALGDRIGYRPR